MNDKKGITNNILMLYIMNITQLVLPLMTLPYLTRVLSVEGYGVVTYVKSIMGYIILIIEFGFLLSGTRDVVETKGNKDELNKVISKVIKAKLFLSVIAFIALLIMIMTIPILHRHVLFTLLSFGAPFLSIFLYDFLFRGLEQMQIVTIRYLIMKGISTLLTFIVIKGESQLNLIPALDIIGSLFAVIWVRTELKKIGLHLVNSNIREILNALKVSFTYFVSDMAATAFGALNTFFVGIYLAPKDIAYWGVTMTLVTAVQSMYNPISDGIYPRMVAKKSLSLFRKIIFFFIPLLIIGGAITYFGATIIMSVIGGEKYTVAAVYLRDSVPLLIISFFTILCGWPLLGAIDKVRETTFTTITTAVLQVIGIAILIFTSNFTIPLLIVVRTITELYMASSRIFIAYKFRNLFNK